MTEAAQAPDTTVIVTGETMNAYAEAKLAGEEFKPEPVVEAKAEEPVVEADQDAEPHPAEAEKTLTPKQIKANERWKAMKEGREAAENKAAAAERELAELRAKAAPPPPPPKADAKPDPDTYKDAEGNFDAFKYAEDLSGWKVKEAFREHAETQQRAAHEAQAKTVLERFNADRDKFRATVQDWEARAEAKKDVQMHGEVIEAIMESDYPAQIMYELTPDDAKRINNLPTMRARIREIARMEASIKAGGTQAAPAAAVVEVSKAPPPITPIKGNPPSSSNKVDKDGNFHGTQEEYEKYRREGKIH